MRDGSYPDICHPASRISAISSTKYGSSKEAATLVTTTLGNLRSVDKEYWVSDLVESDPISS